MSCFMRTPMAPTTDRWRLVSVAVSGTGYGVLQRALPFRLLRGNQSGSGRNGHSHCGRRGRVQRAPGHVAHGQGRGVDRAAVHTVFRRTDPFNQDRTHGRGDWYRPYATHLGPRTWIPLHFAPCVTNIGPHQECRENAENVPVTSDSQSLQPENGVIDIPTGQVSASGSIQISSLER